MRESLSKVPEVTLVFWIIKIAATTLGETGGDTVTMTLQLGLSRRHGAVPRAAGGAGRLQIAANKFHPFLYWATIIASTTFGTTMADFADRSLGIGYTGGSTLLLACLLAALGALVLVGGHDLGRDRQHAEGGSVLLGGHHLLANARHRARRLDGRHRRPRL